MAIDAVVGVTNIVEDMHRNIASISPIVGTSPTGGARGISGLVYQSIRGVTRAIGFGLDAAFALAQLAPLLGFNTWPGRDAALAAVNGLLGDHLVATGNPLAIFMQLRQRGEPVRLDEQALAAEFGQSGGKLLVLVHGLCMNDMQWQRRGHDHGIAAARDLGYTPLYLHYNSGRHISTNGREFADIMERLLQVWPAPVSELAIVGHSMGGLVTRSACHHASLQNHSWLHHVTKLVFLGTPHHGAPLERAGGWVETLMAASPYTAPFARLGSIRSAGIRDLSHGFVLDEQWKDGRSGHASALRMPAPLPTGVQCFAIAATMETAGQRTGLGGDGLVPVASALGEHESAELSLNIPRTHRAIIYGSNHFDLLSDREAYNLLIGWLASA